MSVLDEDGDELLAIDRLVRVGRRVADVPEPISAESMGELVADAILLVDVQGTIAVGGESSPA